MKKEMQREEKMKKLNELDRQKAKEEYLKQQQELAKKSVVHHPVSESLDKNLNKFDMNYLVNLKADRYLTLVNMLDLNLSFIITE